MTPNVIFIGSGFGGTVHACSLAEAGRAVLVLEHGQRWAPDDFPGSPDDAWNYDVDAPAKQNGWIDLRILDDLRMAQGAAARSASDACPRLGRPISADF